MKSRTCLFHNINHPNQKLPPPHRSKHWEKLERQHQNPQIQNFINKKRTLATTLYNIGTNRYTYKFKTRTKPKKPGEIESCREETKSNKFPPPKNPPKSIIPSDFSIRSAQNQNQSMKGSKKKQEKSKTPLSNTDEGMKGGRDEDDVVASSKGRPRQPRKWTSKENKSSSGLGFYIPPTV